MYSTRPTARAHTHMGTRLPVFGAHSAGSRIMSGDQLGIQNMLVSNFCFWMYDSYLSPPPEQVGFIGVRWMNPKTFFGLAFSKVLNLQLTNSVVCLHSNFAPTCGMWNESLA